MRLVRKAILAGAAAIALAGTAGLAAAEIKNAHVLDVRLPDGSLAQIQYVGDTPRGWRRPRPLRKAAASG
jgi:hypothetical protein